MREVGAALRRADVAAIYLAHGTFAGPDALGFLAELDRVLPTFSDAMRKAVKALIDAVARDIGNYTVAYARLFQEAINDGSAEPIPVRLFHWSSENHHIGRADGAVRLVRELADLKLPPGRRVLLWGHSHAGNVFALATHLLAGDTEGIKEFFHAARVYYRWPFVGWLDVPRWEIVRDMLQENPRPLAETPLDVVTFGTPIRYGWNLEGCSRLLHFVHHRPAEGLPEWQIPFPPTPDQILAGFHGDYIQQFGIAGTNIMPNLLAWRAWLADRRLNRLLQPGLLARDLWQRFQAGRRVPEGGTTLLVDYGLPTGNVATHLAGHAIYTRTDWLLFHAEETVRRLYGEEAVDSPTDVASGSLRIAETNP